MEGITTSFSELYDRVFEALKEHEKMRKIIKDKDDQIIKLQHELTEQMERQSTLLRTIRILEFKQQNNVCGVCMEKIEDVENLFNNGCIHSYCIGCIKKYCKMKIESGEVMLTCPSVGCDEVIDYLRIIRILEDDTVLIEKYETYLLNKTLEQMADIVWCPKAECGLAFTRNTHLNNVACPKCKHNFCAECNEDDHEGISCEILQQIKEIDGEIDGIRIWMKDKGRIMKRCPRCRYICDKISGCNKMTCGKCKSYFCWTCTKLLDKKSPYDHYRKGSCDQYDNDEDSEELESDEYSYYSE